MAKTWTCPACGARNAIEAAECASCGRWASIFDIERVDENGEAAAPSQGTAPQQTTPQGAGELARTVLDALRERPAEGPPETDVDPAPSRPASIVKWIVIGAAVLWFVLAPLLERLT